MRGSIAFVAIAIGSAMLSGCQNPSGGDTEQASTTSRARVTTTTTSPRPCPPAGDDLAEPVAAGPNSFDLTSFDGVKLRTHWYPAATTPAPTLIESPGWADLGATPDAPIQRLVGPLAIEALNARGYNVVTWDRRGFGASGGVVAMGAPAIEGRDAVAIIDWIASRPEALLDGERDPRVGMFGGSYGGAIQLVAAAQDCRIDAIAPNMAGSWRSSLAPADTTKVAWLNLLAAGARGATIDPRFLEIVEVANDDGALDSEATDYLDSLGPGNLVGQIDTPTLLAQGTVDTLFGLREAIATFDTLRARGVPTAMVWYCGGHGVCPVGRNDAWVSNSIVAWLDHYLRDIDPRSVATFSTVDQHGALWSMNQAPEPTRFVEARGSASLRLNLASHSGPPDAAEAGSEGGADLMQAITPARADIAAELRIRSSTPSFVVGAPRLELRYRGTAPSGTRPTRVFAQLVDGRSGRVVGGQITPIALVLDGTEQHAVVELAAVSHRIERAGGALVLQLVATTPLFSSPRLGGSVEFDEISLSLPVVDGLERASDGET